MKSGIDSAQILRPTLLTIMVVACVTALARDPVAVPIKSAALGAARVIKRDGSASTERQQFNQAPVGPQYIIGPDDMLRIQVWQEAEISSNVPVRPDGRISLPLIGDLQASGYTPGQLQVIIRGKLQAYITNPEVAVVVQQVNSKKFNIMGEVLHPGSYVLSSPTRVLDALATAGGFRDFAKVTKIYVLRRISEGANIQLPFNYKQVVKGKNPAQNVELESGDTIVVP